MVQPYLGDHDERRSSTSTATTRMPYGDTSAARTGDRDVLYLDEDSARPRRPTGERVAEAALACAPVSLLYGRIDLWEIRLELEVAEPSLYLAFGEGAANRFAKAISRRI